MSETSSKLAVGEDILSRKLLPSQVLARDVNQGLRGRSSFSSLEWKVPLINAHGVRAQLGSTSLGDMLVAPGAELTSNPEIYGGYDHPVIRPSGDANLVGLSVGTWGVHNERRRRLPIGRQVEFANRDDVQVIAINNDEILVEFLGQYDWRGTTHMTFWYQGTNGQQMGERLAVADDHSQPGELPTIESLASIPSSHADSEYTAWNRAKRPAYNETEVALLLNAVQALRMAAV